MNTESFNPAQYKADQRQSWDSVAAGWDRWWPVQEQALQHISDRLVDLAELKPGHRVLDIGTGIGEPAITASRRVGAAGYILATDQSPQMLSVARKRAEILAIQNITFQETDAAAIKFPANSFHAILARFSLMFLPDLADVLTQLRLMLVPEGKFAAAVWDTAAKVPMLNLAFDLARDMFQPPLPPAGTPSTFSLADGILEQALMQANFVNVQAETLTCMLALPSAETFLQFLQDVNVPLINILAAQPAERQAIYWQALAAALPEYMAADGSVHIPGAVICIAGQR